MSNCSPSRQCELSAVFATANAACSQFASPANFQAEQLIYDSAYSDIINSFGIPISYYVNTFNLSAADLLYGEQPTKIFLGPYSIQMYVELNENSINLSRFGFASDDELTGYMHIATFESTIGTQVTYSNYGQVPEPKSGDIIVLDALGCDRPNGRGPKWFEITERVDQDVSQLNPLLGHYVYRVRAKRYEYSFELGLSGELIGEQQNQQVFENSFSGILSSNIPSVSASPIKSYPGDIDDTSKVDVFDMSVNETNIYGTYY
jgi:hypothetical protein